MTYPPSARDIKRGLGSDDRPLCKDLLARDSVPSSPAIRESGNFEPDNIHVGYERYYDPDYARREIDKVWMKSWLLAGREEDIPAVGDRMPFDAGPLSFVIIRSGADSFKAFYNSCLHRGMQLCSAPSSGDSIRCPYHGWEWDIDGALKRIPSWWDFADITRANGSLREVKLGRWGGFIFINADPDCVPLETALGPIPRHFDGYEMENRYTAARCRKLVRGNWKLTQEAFLEGYHAMATHPEIMPFTGDTQSQYEIWDSEHSHIGRIITPSCVPSMHAGPEATALQAATIYAEGMIGWHYPGTDMPALDASGDLRKQLAAWHRAVQLNVYGKAVDEPDAVMLDTILYPMFPHTIIWMSESLPLHYVFTPHPTDPQLSYFDVRIMRPCPAGKPRPPAAAACPVGPEDSVATATGFEGMIGYVFDQDMQNIEHLQRGVRAADPARRHTHLGAYQEMIIQHWHALFDRHMAR